MIELPPHLAEAAEQFDRVQRIANWLSARLDVAERRIWETYDWFVADLPPGITDDELDELLMLVGYHAAYDAVQGIRQRTG